MFEGFKINKLTDFVLCEEDRKNELISIKRLIILSFIEMLKEKSGKNLFFPKEIDHYTPVRDKLRIEIVERGKYNFIYITRFSHFFNTKKINLEVFLSLTHLQQEKHVISCLKKRVKELDELLKYFR